MFEEYLIMLIGLELLWLLILPDHNSDLQDFNLGAQRGSELPRGVNGPERCHLTTCWGSSQNPDVPGQRSHAIQGISGMRRKDLFGNVSQLRAVGLIARKAKSKSSQEDSDLLLFISPHHDPMEKVSYSP